jgi:TM2 domain-containing membrane protein YozV
MHERAIALYLCLAALAPVAQAQELARPQKRKAPAASWALSFVYPGLGQAYNRDWGRAVAFAGTAGIGWGLYWSSWEDCVVNHTKCSIRNASQVIILAAWIGAQIDAPRRAIAINRKRSLSLEVGPAPHSLGLSLARISF